MSVRQKKEKPVRTCIACRQKFNKDELIHICYKDDLLYLNPKSSIGRGAYLCKNQKCVDLAFKKKAFNQAFKTNLSLELLDEIKLIIKNESVEFKDGGT